ncbi:MAG: pseudaminic acid cytidylyltransferase [Lachnospiraceae bacterium]|nr:pseudaminic acid cytidylyltransferase [Lachnospiraceae bacterium]
MDRAIAIITARGGSKRIPRKNVKEFCGKPIIYYSIKAALDVGVFDKVMVSTDDDEIAQLAIKYGAEVPFKRSQETAGDFATTAEVLMEVIKAYHLRGEDFDRFCCIYPTCPLLKKERLKEAMLMLSDCDGVMPVVKFSFPPQRSVFIKDGYLKSSYPEFANSRSQDLEAIYHDSGQFYALRTEAFLAAGALNIANLKPIILTEMEVQDIDTIDDWKLAELKYNYLARNS